MHLLTGYCSDTVPLGFYPADTVLGEANPLRSQGPNYPFGLTFMGTAYTEFALISYAYAYEQTTHMRLAVRAFPEAVPKTHVQLADVR